MKKIILILCLISFHSFAFIRFDLTQPDYPKFSKWYPAYQELDLMNFADGDDDDGKMAIFALKKYKTDKKPSLMYIAKISSSKAGMQRIYIYLPDKCIEDRVFGNDVIFVKVDHQNVKFNQYCEHHEMYLTPKTKAGENFIVHQFIREKGVFFEFPDITVVFDAKGFKKSWDNFGGNAL